MGSLFSDSRQGNEERQLSPGDYYKSGNPNKSTVWQPISCTHCGQIAYYLSSKEIPADVIVSRQRQGSICGLCNYLSQMNETQSVQARPPIL
jgi:hypothetical protein